jgi:hypothetical protein
VHRQVGSTGDHSVAHRADENPLTTDFRERGTGAVAFTDHLHKVDSAAEFDAKPSRDLLGLGAS